MYNLEVNQDHRAFLDLHSPGWPLGAPPISTMNPKFQSEVFLDFFSPRTRIDLKQRRVGATAESPLYICWVAGHVPGRIGECQKTSQRTMKPRASRFAGLGACYKYNLSVIVSFPINNAHGGHAGRHLIFFLETQNPNKDIFNSLFVSENLSSNIAFYKSFILYFFCFNLHASVFFSTQFSNHPFPNLGTAVPLFGIRT